MGTLLFLSAVGLIILIVFVMKTFVIVPQQNVYIKERLGKYAGNLEAGFHFLVPFIDRVAYKQTLKEEVIDVQPQGCITRDNVQVEVDGILYVRVLNPERASYGIHDYRFAAMQLAQANMRSEIGKMDLDTTFKEREKINDNVVKNVDEASDPWGIKVIRYEIKNIDPPPTILDAMDRQMKAAREKRAEILESEGKRSATINRSEGDKQHSINLSMGEKTRRINEAEGNARQIEVIAEAQAEAIRLVAEAVNTPAGQEAMQLRIAQEYIRRFGEVLKKSHTTVAPLSIANIQGVFEGVSKTMDAVSHPGGQGKG